MKEKQQRKQKWVKQKEKNQRCGEVDGVKEKAGSQSKVKHIKKSDELFV